LIDGYIVVYGGCIPDR